MDRNYIFKNMVSKWPSSIVARSEIEAFTGGLISKRYCANLDCLGLGPEGRIRVGRKIAYPVESVIRFLEARAEVVKPRKQEAIS
jgi:hypothetical protein